MTVATYPVSCHVCGRMVPKDQIRFRTQFEDKGNHHDKPRRHPLVRYFCGARCVHHYAAGAWLKYLETMYGDELGDQKGESDGD